MKPVLVVDASVSVKWFLSAPPGEASAAAALALLEAYSEDRFSLYQPPVWRSEVLGVLCRLAPLSASRYAQGLLSFDYRLADADAVYLKAIELSIQLDHHLFDTIYHAAALLHPQATFVTADEKYRAKGERLGRILPLVSWKDALW
ncbi:type II toxin-antitoxin system VapC family toxin [Geomesophilobacter sediminis]|uniref:Type II toxin-antitoxin system VapC family toxin n=1 Tax=Geomesophilobacter sediminis TaxID=2798584 RepID=A0A8J7SAP1_9BACT|nr:type II toxin-antitoxin system VapC family toxin [Geomesophilobacter sediminis]MBJ6727401.1 type II toxin-antitoxin system VapC family toxin [Geomesophilobacter sediminis]